MLCEQTGRSLTHELYEAKGRFDELIITHPGILAVELAMIKAMEKIGVNADLVAGNSLGEFAAGVASGVWSEEQAMLSCIKRAEAIVEHIPSGGMIAVLSERSPELTADLNSFGLYVASDNFKGHFTVSGLAENIREFKQYLDNKGITCQLLEVAWPFHSPYMEQVELPLDLASIPLNRPGKITMYSPLQRKEIRSAVGEYYFWDAVSQPFDFGVMLSQLEENYGPCLYIDLGPSGTMATFVKYNLPPESSSIPITILSPFKGDTERLQALKATIRKNKPA